MFYYYGRKKKIVKYYPKPIYDTIIEPFAGCYDPVTRVMTKTGLKYFKDLTLVDEIMTLNSNTNQIEYHQPSRLHEYDYDGELIKLEGKSYNLLVTPNHNMYIKESRHKSYSLIQADQLTYRNYQIPVTGNWQGYSIEYFVLPKVDGKKHCTKIFNDILIKMDVWIKFMGWYLSEGWCTKNGYYVSIAQKEDRPEIREILDVLPFSYHRCKRQYKICSKQLNHYLVQFGHAHQKFIPRYIKQLSPHYLRLFLDAYVMVMGINEVKLKPFGQFRNK